MIIGEIRRHLRDNNSVRVSRSMRDLAYRAMQVKERLTSIKNKEPTIEEIASELDVPKESIVLSLESIVEPISLDEPLFSDNNGDTVYVMDQIGDKNDDINWLEEICIKQALCCLSDREKIGAYIGNPGMILALIVISISMVVQMATAEMGL